MVVHRWSFRLVFLLSCNCSYLLLFLLFMGCAQHNCHYYIKTYLFQLARAITIASALPACGLLPGAQLDLRLLSLPVSLRHYNHLSSSPTIYIRSLAYPGLAGSRRRLRFGCWSSSWSTACPSKYAIAYRHISPQAMPRSMLRAYAILELSKYLSLYVCA